MGEIVHLNIRGLKTESLRQNKILLIKKILDNHYTKILSLQETRLKTFSDIPKSLRDLSHIYNISFCEANDSDPGSGILVFVKKKQKISFQKKN